MKNKKGALLFNLIIVIMLTFVLGYAWLQLDGKYRSFDKSLGERQYDLIRIYQKGENVLYYVDQSAKYALQEAIYHLADDGGISEIEVSDREMFAKHECGKFGDSYVWYKISKTDSTSEIGKCFDESKARDHFEYRFDAVLKEYLEKAPYNMPQDYAYEFKDNSILGIASNPLKLEVNGAEYGEINGLDDVKTDDGAKAAEDAKGEKPKPDDKLFSGGKSGGAGSGEEFTAPEKLRDFTSTPFCARGSRCLLTEEAYDLVVKAQERANAIAKEKKMDNAPIIEIYSSYRSKEQQERLWNGLTPERYAQRYPNPEDRNNYVCNPAGGEAKCPHMSAKVVDVRFRGKTTKTMSGKDWSLLYEIMTTTKAQDNKPAWVRYSIEPWHFECCKTERHSRAMEKGVTSII